MANGKLNCRFEIRRNTVKNIRKRNMIYSPKMRFVQCAVLTSLCIVRRSGLLYHRETKEKLHKCLYTNYLLSFASIAKHYAKSVKDLKGAVKQHIAYCFIHFSE